MTTEVVLEYDKRVAMHIALAQLWWQNKDTSRMIRVMMMMMMMIITHQNYRANENLIMKHEEEFKKW